LRNGKYGERTSVVLLATRNLFQDKIRLALSIIGVALAVMLILVLEGLLAGMNRQITSYLDHPGSPVARVNLRGDFCSCRMKFAENPGNSQLTTS
jgi:hypothetical protein